MKPIRAIMLLLAFAYLAGPLAACSRGDGESGNSARTRLLERNLAAEALLPTAVLDSLLSAESALPTGRRLGLWTRRFLADDESEYRFGLKEGGYVAEGLIVSDHRHDCVSLLYRCSELAKAEDHEDALEIALKTRFAGARPDSIVDAQGRLDYEDPSHLDFSLDMIRAGHWGRDVTADLSGARPDTVGTARFPAGSFRYLPTAALGTEELREGDVAWFVLNPEHPSARKLRDEYHLVIGHIGLLIEEAGEIVLVHAASGDLAGVYEGGRVVRVPLKLYLDRVDRFAGVIITRF